MPVSCLAGLGRALWLGLFFSVAVAVCVYMLNVQFWIGISLQISLNVCLNQLTLNWFVYPRYPILCAVTWLSVSRTGATAKVRPLHRGYVQVQPVM